MQIKIKIFKRDFYIFLCFVEGKNSNNKKSKADDFFIGFCNLMPSKLVYAIVKK